MAYWVRVGKVPYNLSGVGARGWQAFRRGRIVCTGHGKIIVTGTHTSTFRWASPGLPRRSKKTFRSDDAARRRLAELIAEKEAHQSDRGGGYQRLPRGGTIRPCQSS
jgi:hypothetical protein